MRCEFARGNVNSLRRNDDVGQNESRVSMRMHYRRLAFTTLTIAQNAAIDAETKRTVRNETAGAARYFRTRQRAIYL